MKRIKFDVEVLTLIADVFLKIQDALISGELSFNDENGYPDLERAEALIRFIDILGSQMNDQLGGQVEKVDNVPMSGLWNREDTPEG